MNCRYLIVGLLIASAACGCSGKKTNPFGSLAARFSKKDSNDPLALDTEQVSKGFVAANKKLQAPEATMLRFAQWKEDMGQYAEAKQRYREILTENESCLDARLGIARIERATGRFDQCLDILMTANQQNPNNAQVLLELGRSHSDRDPGKAVRYLKQAADAHPNDEQVRFALGIALAKAGEYDDAVAHLRYAVGESAALFNVGFVLNESGHAEEARTWIQNSLDAHPDDRTRRAARELLTSIDRPAQRAVPEAPFRNAPLPGRSPVNVASLPNVQPSQLSQQVTRETPVIQAAPTNPLETNVAAAAYPQAPPPVSQYSQTPPMSSPIQTTSAYTPHDSLQQTRPQVPIHTAAMHSVAQPPITQATQQRFVAALPFPQTAPAAPVPQAAMNAQPPVAPQPAMTAYQPVQVPSAATAAPTSVGGIPAQWNSRPQTAPAAPNGIVNPPQWRR